MSDEPALRQGLEPSLPDPAAPPLPVERDRGGGDVPPATVAAVDGREARRPAPAAAREPVRILDNARSIALLALVGFALVLFFQTLAIKADTRHEFFLRNLLGAKPRKLLL